jgi:hypothetical protein
MKTIGIHVRVSPQRPASITARAFAATSRSSSGICASTAGSMSAAHARSRGCAKKPRA